MGAPREAVHPLPSPLQVITKSLSFLESALVKQMARMTILEKKAFLDKVDGKLAETLSRLASAEGLLSLHGAHA